MRYRDERVPSAETWNEMLELGHARFVISRGFRDAYRCVSEVVLMFALVFFVIEVDIHMSHAFWPYVAAALGFTLLLAMVCAEGKWRAGCAAHDFATSSSATHNNA
jgi:hypothetical protein